MNAAMYSNANKIKRANSRGVTGAVTLFFIALSILSPLAAAQDIRDEVVHSYAENNGTKIHYAKMGSGPLIVFIHGFPDLW